jgi:hypothetical protein
VPRFCLLRCRAWGFLVCFAGPLGLLLGSCLLYWSLVELVARVLVSALVLLLLFEAFYPVRFPLHWYLASVSCLAATWSLMTCFDRPLSLSLGSWSFQLFYFGSTECTSLLAHLRYWCLASVSCVVALGAFWLALLVPWACCLGPACFTGPLLRLSLGSWSRHLFYSCSSKRSILLARPLHWYLASVSCLVGNWSLITCFDRPLSLSLGSWAFQLFYFGSTECTSLLAHLRYWCLASVSCVVTFGAFWLALLVPWACCSGPGLADASACVFGILHLARSSLCLTHCVCRLVFIFALFGT